MSYYTIHLVNVQVVQPVGIARQVIEQALGPLIRQAGHQANFVNVPVAGQCDVSLEFVRNFPRMGAQFMGPMVLAEQSGAVLVGSILEMRVGGEQSTRIGYANATRPLFQNGEDTFARTVGNVAVHELGHTIGGLPHERDSRNFMYTGAFLAQDHHSSWFTYDNLRRHWSARRTFNAQQHQMVVGAIQTRQLLGIDMQRVP